MKIFLFKRVVLKLQILFLFLLALNVFGAPGDVDPGFNPRLRSVPVPGSLQGGTFFLQPDGKILVFGPHFAQRLNPDGSIDESFQCVACLPKIPQSAAVQPDGKIIISIGGYTSSPPNGNIFRVTSTGELDPTFKSPFNSENESCSATDIIVQPDGKYLLQCQISPVFPSSISRAAVKRINPDGTIDTSFTQMIFPASDPWLFINKTLLLPDGKILVGGRDSEERGWLRRFNADGNPDTTFQSNPSGTLFGIDLLPDGKYLIGGDFSSVNGTGRPKIARLNTDGSVDTSFNPPAPPVAGVEGVKVLPNGQFYARVYTILPGTPPGYPHRFVRFNADGSVDNTYNNQDIHFHEPWAVDALNRIITFKSASPQGYYRFDTNGNIDPTFVPAIEPDGIPTAAALQTDGKLVIAGSFQKANGVAANRIVRVNPDGTTDTSFSAGTGFDSAAAALSIQTDGKILAGGSFTTVNGVSRKSLARLNADGSLDTAFNPVLDFEVVAVQSLPNGQILIGGNFTAVNGVSRTGVALLNADGSLDASFNPVIAPPNGVTTIYAVLRQPDGKIMVGGRFANVNGTSRIGVVRLNADGSLDAGFNFTQLTSGFVKKIFQRPDGKYFFLYTSTAGSFFYTTLGRFKADGSPDNFSRTVSFGSEDINAFYEQPNGSVIYGGKFFDNKNIARVGPSGQADIYFPTYGANDTVNQIIAQPDGKILVFGSFTGFDRIPRTGVARITLGNRLTGVPFDFDGDGKADISVFRPSTNVWYELLSRDYSVGIQSLGASGDVPVPADYDGDGKTDAAVFRPSIGDWIYLNSATNTVTQIHFGQTGDIPRPSDSTGSGKAQPVVYRPSTGIWYGISTLSPIFGAPGDQPLVGDFDGDGRSDPAVFRPSSGDWWYAASAFGGAHHFIHWGQTGDIPSPADVDADGKTDFVVYRPSNGGWYILRSGEQNYTILQFGTAEDKPVMADYDGDGKADVAVFRPSTGIWYLLQTTAGFGAVQWGVSTDIPTENAFLP